VEQKKGCWSPRSFGNLDRGGDFQETIWRRKKWEKGGMEDEGRRPFGGGRGGGEKSWRSLSGQKK